MAKTLASGGRDEEASYLLGAANSTRETVGGGAGWVAEDMATTEMALRDRLPAGDFDAAFKAGGRLDPDEAVGYALALAAGTVDRRDQASGD